MVISDRSEALILDKASKLGIENFYCSAHSKQNFELQVHKYLLERNIELIVLIGFMRILSPEFVALWPGKILNVHPSLLPLFAGKMDLAVHKAVLNEGHRQSGCTVHEVTKDLDGGPIVIQMTCPIYLDDTPESLKKKVQVLEVKALATSIQAKLQEKSRKIF